MPVKFGDIFGYTLEERDTFYKKRLGGFKTLEARERGTGKKVSAAFSFRRIDVILLDYLSKKSCENEINKSLLLRKMIHVFFQEFSENSESFSKKLDDIWMGQDVKDYFDEVD
jgi:hypothetical protein